MLEIGSLVDGKYRILRVVGKGGMSVVYQAVNEKANKIWAIKEVRKDGVQNYEVVKQNLIVETDLLKRFNHPNLPSIIDVIDGDGTFLIVMDYIEGNSLSKALETSGAQNQSDVIEWSKQLCDVLGYLHSQNPPIIYRDMKPANVMLKPDGKVSLIDFGTAREFKSSSVEDTTCLGTMGYAAPEQYGGHGQTDPRTDIYNLGATMYHLVTGHNPSTPPYEMYPIRQWNPMLSSGLEEIILKCTQRNPEDRYQSCAELLYALDHYEDLDIENRRKRNLKWKLFMASTIAMLVLLVGSLGFSIASSALTAQTYDSLTREGEKAMNASDVLDNEDYKRAESNFNEAIDRVENDNLEAYKLLLSLYLKDGKITTEEYTKLRTKTNLYDRKLMARDEAGYMNDFVLPLANNLCFIYDSTNKVAGEKNVTGMGNAANWYKIAKDSSATDSKNKRKAEVMYILCSNAGKEGQIDETGETKLQYDEYWALLKSLIDEDLFASDNLLIQLHMYRIVSSEMYLHAKDFKNKGISSEEFEETLRQIEKKTLDIENGEQYRINTEGKDGGDTLGLGLIVEGIKTNVENARNSRLSLDKN